ncbi:18590_t:CDS:2, partial [Funneliformis geosporum]
KSSLEIAQLQSRVSQFTKSKFSQMLTCNSTSTSVTGSTMKRTHGKSTELASVDTTSKNTTEDAFLKNATEVTTLENTTKATTSKNITEATISTNTTEEASLKNTTDTRVVHNLDNLTLNDENSRGFNTEDYCDKSGEDTHYDISQETHNNIGDYNNIKDFYEDYYSQTRDKDKYSYDK